MIAAKLDLLIKKMEEGSQRQIQAPVDAMGSHFTCEVCGNDGHSGNDYLETREDCAYLNNNNNNNNGYRPPQGGQGWNQPRPPFQGGNNYNSSFSSNFNSNQPPLRELVLGQVKINENINKKLLANDKTLENLNVNLETLSSMLKNQSSFNKMIETQLAQIAAALHVAENGKIPGQPEPPIESVNMVLSVWGNTSQMPPRTNHAGKYNSPRNDSWDGLVATVQEDPGVLMISCSIYNKYYEHALCDLGASVIIMPKVIFEELQYPTLSPTTMLVQLADSTIRYPEGIAEHAFVRV
jgi:hypothetical protein